MDEKLWYLKNCPLFERLTSAQVVAVEGASHARRFSRGEMIYMPADAGDCVFLVSSGRVKLYHITADGKQALLALIDPGEVFGELAVVDGGAREEFAEVMEPALVVKIPRDVIQSLMEQHSGVALGVTKLMGLRRQRVERRLKSLLYRSNRDRLIHLLLELAEKYGVRTQEGIQIGVKLSHQELASIIGSTRETVTVVLGELQNEGRLIIRRRQIVLQELETLAHCIAAEPPRLPTEPPLARVSRAAGLQP
ncbi:MAG: Crp/Fnr family transcriptional regulator [Planctomycetota bacterium]|mgnify:CR=1 FL=1|nr:MAG: Crp/Fnr family transcriptional regulator [Planctomycetota bacterium]REK24799.1 MAG: Crp/Fnr family transcriptional regulator [Planctomycetota bacterium]REK38828.1 MAG: Crp/Fnr family transcriptional regulator [Planctomycetota bacterium]